MIQRNYDVYHVKGFELRVYDYNCLHSRVEIWKGGVKRCERIAKTSATRRAAQSVMRQYLEEKKAAAN